MASTPPNSTNRCSLTELPLDVLMIIFPYLDAKDFLALCRTCKAFQQDSIRLDPAYWKHAVQSAFRVPNQPIVQSDGARWYKLFRRLKTQSRVFTWGLNSDGRLGHRASATADPPSFRGGRIGVGSNRFRNRPFPDEMEPDKLQENEITHAIIADLQCGGWSTTILTSEGHLYTCGHLDGQRFHSRPSSLTKLCFPKERLESQKTIRQFSSGRSHILGLSDNGGIWAWHDKFMPAIHVKFLHYDILEASSGKAFAGATSLQASTRGRVKKVLAGWSLSSAYIYGHGIVVWDPVGSVDEEDNDTMLVLDSVTIPKTGYKRPKGRATETEEEAALREEVGVVLNYILLEHFVVFVTDIGKVFCGKFGDNNQVERILELGALRGDESSPIDVQGSFRRFALLKGKEVITTNQDYLDACWENSTRAQDNTEGLHRIPALQHNDVISVAFGDYHYLALHSTGKITSYGTELQGCGALGLGSSQDDTGHARGISYHPRHGGKLLPHAYTRGREVWFGSEKYRWIRFLAGGGVDPEESDERIKLWHEDRMVQGEVSEWFEQEGRDWDKNVETEDDGGLSSHFALSISAAGWHSGALVLVNEDLARRVREKYCGVQPLQEATWADRSFPRLRLSDGREMPGTVEFDEWKYGRPEWKLDIDD